MQLDVEDVFAGVFGSMLGRALCFVLAVWTGCLIGAAGLTVGGIAAAGRFPPAALRGYLGHAPLLLVSMWGVLNVPFLLFSFIYFIRSELLGWRAWGWVIALQSLTVMAGWAKSELHGGLPLAAGWLAWLVLLVMVEAGVWLVFQMARNRWARQLAELRAENARRSAEREAEQSGAPPTVTRDTDG